MESYMKKILCLLAVCLLLPVPSFAAEEAALRPYQKDTKKWTHVFLGQTPTKADETRELVSWRVLSVSGQSALLLSDRILFTARIDAQQNVYEGWEQSELYEYLNGAFLKDTFTWAERCILLRQKPLQQLQTGKHKA